MRGGKYMLGGDVALALTRNASSVVYRPLDGRGLGDGRGGARPNLEDGRPCVNCAGSSPPTTLGPPSVKRRSVIARAVGALTKLVVTRWPFRIRRRLVPAKDFWPRASGAH